MSNLNDKIIIHVVTGETETKKEKETMTAALDNLSKALGVTPEPKHRDMQIDRLFLETIRAHAENVASNDATKFHLNHVRIRVTEPGVVEIASSDGIKLVTSTLRIGPAADLFRGSDWFAEIDACDTFKNLLKGKKDATFEATKDNGIVSIKSSRGASTRLVSDKRAMLDYPKVEEYMAQSFETEVAIMFNVQYLADIVAAAMKGRNNGIVELRFDPNKQRGPIMVIADSDEVKTRATLMPVRGAKETPRLMVDAGAKNKKGA
jgi:hypothetical protein